MKKHVPNIITLGNLTAGCFGIQAVFADQLILAGQLIFLAAVLDFFDGFAARMLNVSSPIGKQLDSLADMVSFGLLPGFIMMSLIYSGPPESLFFQLKYIAFLIPIFSALRLAKFNIDENQSDGFIGLPTPANAILIASLPLIGNSSPDNSFLVSNTGFLFILTVVLSGLLVLPLPMLALKFKHFRWVGNQARYVFVALSVIALGIFFYKAIPLIIGIYLLVSIFEASRAKTTTH